MTPKHITELFRRVVDQILMLRSHVIFSLDCSEATGPEFPAGEVLTVLSHDNIGSHQALCKAVIALNPENLDYLNDIAKDRIVGVIISVDQMVVHYGFLMKENRNRRLLGLPKDAALIGNSCTVSSYRGRGCQGRSVLERARIARDAGFRFIFAETSPQNLSSQRGMEKAGMKALGRLDMLVVFRYLVIRWRRPEGFSGWSWCQ